MRCPLLASIARVRVGPRFRGDFAFGHDEVTSRRVRGCLAGGIELRVGRLVSGADAVLIPHGASVSFQRAGAAPRGALHDRTSGVKEGDGMKNRKGLLFLGAILAAGLGAAACDGGGRECGPGTVADGNSCVPACGAGERWDEDADRCLSVCAEGTSWSSTTGRCEAEPGVECGPGTHEEGGECVPDDLECAPGTLWDEEAGACVADCVAGTHRDDETGACVPDSAACVSGQVWDPEAAECVDAADYCAEGTTWVASERRCVPNDELIAADQVEGTDENDPFYGGMGAWEELVLPAVGGRRVIGGTIDAPADKDGDGALDPDVDYWVFAVAGPTLLRLTSDGVGGASAGFAVAYAGEELDFVRYGIGTTMDGAARDVLLPTAGVYAILATDAMNLLTSSGPYFGGEGFGYFVAIETLSRPTATDLAFADGVAATSATWPAAPPASGSMLGFFALDLEVGADEAGALFDFELSTETPEVAPVLMAFLADGTFLFQATGPRAWGTAADADVCVVADYEIFFSGGDTDYDVTVRDRGLATLDGPPAPTTIDQPEWTWEDETDYPWTYFGFAATEGDVVTLLATTSTGATYFEVTSSDLATSFGSIEGMDYDPVYDGEIRFRAPYTGLYVVHVLGLEGLEGLWFVERIPAHSFEVTLAVLEQTPAEVTPPETFDDVTVDERAYEAFFLLDPAAGESFWVEVAGEGGLDPVVSLYGVAEPGPLVGTARPDLAFPIRFPDAGPLLLGVADDDHEGGSFDLSVLPLAVEDLGALAGAAPVDVDGHAVAETDSRAFFVFTPDAAGIATITVTPTGFDVAIATRDATLAELAHVNDQSPDVVETIDLVVAASTPAFFEVRTADGAPFGAGAAVDVAVELAPFTVEVEPNDGPSAALGLSSPDLVVGSVGTAGDRDWYSVTVAGAALLTSETGPLLGAGPMDTVLRLYDTDGVTELAFDDDGGEGLYSRIVYELPGAGTYFLEVGGYGDASTGDYLLSVRTLLTLFRESFDTEIPAGWLAVDHDGDGESWSWCDGTSTAAGCRGNDTGSASGGGMAIMNSDHAGQADDSLRTPAIDCSGATWVSLELDHNYNYLGGDHAAVEVSLDGTSWTEVARFEADTIGHSSIDVSDVAAGEASVWFRFYYSAGWDWYWLIDDVTVLGS